MSKSPHLTYKCSYLCDPCRGLILLLGGSKDPRCRRRKIRPNLPVSRVGIPKVCRPSSSPLSGQVTLLLGDGRNKERWGLGRSIRDLFREVQVWRCRFSVWVIGFGKEFNRRLFSGCTRRRGVGRPKPLPLRESTRDESRTDSPVRRYVPCAREG